MRRVGRRLLRGPTTDLPGRRNNAGWDSASTVYQRARHIRLGSRGLLVVIRRDEVVLYRQTILQLELGPNGVDRIVSFELWELWVLLFFGYLTPLLVICWSLQRKLSIDRDPHCQRFDGICKSSAVRLHLGVL